MHTKDEVSKEVSLFYNYKHISSATSVSRINDTMVIVEFDIPKKINIDSNSSVIYKKSLFDQSYFELKIDTNKAKSTKEFDTLFCLNESPTEMRDSILKNKILNQIHELINTTDSLKK